MIVSEQRHGTHAKRCTSMARSETRSQNLQAGGGFASAGPTDEASACSNDL